MVDSIAHIGTCEESAKRIAVMSTPDHAGSCTVSPAAIWLLKIGPTTGKARIPIDRIRGRGGPT